MEGVADKIMGNRATPEALPIFHRLFYCVHRLAAMLLAEKLKRCNYYIRSCYSYYCLTPHFFLIASHFYRLTAHALCGDDEMRESIGGDGVLIHGEQDEACCSVK